MFDAGRSQRNMLDTRGEFGAGCFLEMVRVKKLSPNMANIPPKASAPMTL